MNNVVGDAMALANPRDFYPCIRSQKRHTRQKRNGSCISKSKSEKADEFNGQFTGLCSPKTEHNQVTLRDRSVPSIE